jgi:DNA repair photolyase
MFPSKKRTGKTKLGYKFISKFENDYKEVWCPNFYIMHQAAGCPYKCSYCYLRVLLRGGPKLDPRWYNNLGDMAIEIAKWIDETAPPASLNCGSVCDPLAINTNYLNVLMPMFAASRKRLNLNILTKAGINTAEAHRPLEMIAPNDNVTFSWSLNSTEVAERYEPNAPTPTERLLLAKKYKRYGWPVRYRIDPMMPIKDWKTSYAKLVDNIFEHWVVPDVITLGTLRELPALKTMSDREPYAPSRDLQELMTYDKDFHHRRLSDDLREEMYSFVYERIGNHFGTEKVHEVPVALCKETKDMNKKVLGRLPQVCNCMHSSFIPKIKEVAV